MEDRKGGITMKKALLLISLILVLSFCDGKSYRLKGGRAITIEGDTVEFYGGEISSSFIGNRSIRMVIIKE